MFEKIKEKQETRKALTEVRSIIINELKKDYYEKAANIKEVIEIKKEVLKFSIGVDSYRKEYMNELAVIYMNGFVTFESNQIYLVGIKNPREEVEIRKVLAKKKSTI